VKLRTQLTPGTWVRGRASLDGEYVVLDRTRSSEYQPLSTTDLVFDLAAIRRPSDALPFVRRYGLLFHGPNATESREPWTDWERVSGLLSGLLHLYVVLQKAIRGDVAANHELRTRWGELIQRLYEQVAETDEVFYQQATDFLAYWTSHGLENVEFGIDAAARYEKDGKAYGGVGDFVLTARPPNLVGYAYHQLALLLSRGVEGARCPECGRVFVVKDRRQRFCSPQCAQRARYRRWKERKS